ncbi:hypothetical protein [Salinibaculum rarum]|uniref:hypothetical protein n=1 Tax=Salinibaculum rarum TaxID=3058903 RepID=UPI0026600420|nr:hypothetical protein [Salinibaculum sp. KK48]
MGAYLRYRVANAANASLGNSILESQPEFETLKDAECPHPWFWTEADEAQLDFDYHLEIGEGNTKVNGPTPPGGRDAFAEALTSLFEVLHEDERITVEVSAGSCALGEDTLNGEPFTYFTPEQAARLTDDGCALTGDIDAVLSRLPAELCDVPHPG